MSSPNPELINIAPYPKWATIHEPEGIVDMYHPFDRSGTGLEGVDHHLRISTRPLEFKRNADWKDGMEALDGAVERSLDEGKQFEVSVVFTDPSRPDGLGENRELENAVSKFGMIFHSEMRSVFHAGNSSDYGIKYGFLPTSRGAMLGIDPAHPEYRSKLAQLLESNRKENGIPYDSFGASVVDPENLPNLPLVATSPPLALSLAHTVQFLRANAYVKASEQEDMETPDLDFFVPDMIHTSTLQWLQLGIAGLKMQEHADEHTSGVLPEKVLFIMPVEHGAFVDKLEQSIGDPARVNAGLILPDMLTDAYVEDQFTTAYDIGLRTARLRPGQADESDLPLGHSNVELPHYYHAA